MVDKIIELIEEMDEELDGAKNYAIKAEACFEHGNVANATAYAEMAKQEMEHYDKLHKMLTGKLEEHTKTSGDHDSLKAMYDYHHRKQTEKMAKVKQVISMVKGY